MIKVLTGLPQRDDKNPSRRGEYNRMPCEELPDMIPVPVDRYALIHNDHWFTDHCHQKHSVSIIAEVHYFPYSGHYGIKFINGIQTSCPLDELLTAEVVKDGDPGTPKYRKEHNIA
jgi:hypothetical protein